MPMPVERLLISADIGANRLLPNANGRMKL